MYSALPKVPCNLGLPRMKVGQKIMGTQKIDSPDVRLDLEILGHTGVTSLFEVSCLATSEGAPVNLETNR